MKKRKKKDEGNNLLSLLHLVTKSKLDNRVLLSCHEIEIKMKTIFLLPYLETLFSKQINNVL